MAASIKSICEGYLIIYPEEQESLKKLLEQIQKKGEDTIRSRREFDNGHITCAAFILNNDFSKIVMIDHAFLGDRLQPGGHSEPGDKTTFDTALREAQEETGLMENQLKYIPVSDEYYLVPVDIDVHDFPERPQKDEPAHIHFDFRYLFIAKDGATVVAHPDESKGIYWVPFKEFENDSYFARPAKKIRKLLKF